MTSNGKLYITSAALKAENKSLYKSSLAAVRPGFTRQKAILKLTHKKILKVFCTRLPVRAGIQRGEAMRREEEEAKRRTQHDGKDEEAEL